MEDHQEGYMHVTGDLRAEERENERENIQRNNGLKFTNLFKTLICISKNLSEA